MLEQWRFSEELIATALEADDWFRDHSGNADLADIVIVAQLLNAIGTPRILQVPPIRQVPAFQRVMGPDMNITGVYALLAEADGRIEEMKQLLRGD